MGEPPILKYNISSYEKFFSRVEKVAFYKR